MSRFTDSHHDSGIKPLICWTNACRCRTTSR